MQSDDTKPLTPLRLALVMEMITKKCPNKCFRLLTAFPSGYRCIWMYTVLAKGLNIWNVRAALGASSSLPVDLWNRWGYASWWADFHIACYHPQNTIFVRVEKSTISQSAKIFLQITCFIQLPVLNFVLHVKYVWEVFQQHVFVGEFYICVLTWYVCTYKHSQ